MGRFNANTKPAASGSYIGDHTVGRGIEHELGRKPNAIFWQRVGAARDIKEIQPGTIDYTSHAASDRINVGIPDEKYFYVGNVSSMSFSCNSSGQEYFWVAV